MNCLRKVAVFTVFAVIIASISIFPSCSSYASDNSSHQETAGFEKVIPVAQKVPDGYVVVGYTNRPNFPRAPGGDYNAKWIKKPGFEEVIPKRHKVPKGYTVVGYTRKPDFPRIAGGGNNAKRIRRD